MRMRDLNEVLGVFCEKLNLFHLCKTLQISSSQGMISMSTGIPTGRISNFTSDNAFDFVLCTFSLGLKGAGA